MTAALMLTLFLAPAIPAADLPPLSAINDLADAPHVAERFRFPDSPTAEASLRFDTACRERLKDERDLWPEAMQPIFETTIAETWALREPWWHLSWAQWGARREWERRLDLKRLRECLTEEEWRDGRLPPAAPVWRFRSLK